METGEQLPSVEKPDQPTDRYPDMTFDIARLHLFPAEGEIFEITDTTRLTRTLQALGEACPEFTITPKERERRLHAQKNYMTGKVTVNNQRQEFRKKIVDVDSGYSEAIKLLMAVNHPATQLLRQIDSHYNQERDHDTEMRLLAHNITTVFAWDQLRGIFDHQIDAHHDQAFVATIGSVTTQATLRPSDSPAA
jgi:hypothetical protein